MRQLLALLVCVGSVFAQPSPSTLNLPADTNSEVPYFASTTVTGTVAVGSCTDTVGSGLGGALKTSVVGQVVNVFANNSFAFTLGSTSAVTNYQCQMVVVSGGACPGSGCLTINATLNPKPNPIYQTANNLCPGCTTTNAVFGTTDTAPGPQGQPGTSYVPLATNGSTEVDTEFGTVRMRVSPSGVNRVLCGDAIAIEFSYDDLYVCTLSLSGQKYLTAVNGSGDAYTLPSAISGAITFMDPLNPYIYYMPQDSSVAIKRATWTDNFATPTQICAYTGNASYLTNSSDESMNYKGWVAALTQGGTDPVHLFLCNVYTGATATYDLSTVAVQYIPVRGDVRVAKDFDSNSDLIIEVGGGQSQNGTNTIFAYNGFSQALRFVGALPLNPQTPWNFGTTNNTFKIQPTVLTDCGLSGVGTTNGGCRYSEHTDEFQAYINNQSHAFKFAIRGSTDPSWAQMAAQDITNGRAAMEIDIESGGGQYTMTPTNHDTSGAHMTCAALAPVCLLDKDGDAGAGGQFGQPTVYPITGLTTSGGNPTLSFSGGTTGLTAGNTLLIGGVLGITGMPSTGVTCTVGTITSNSFPCTNLTTSGTWTASTGDATLNVVPSSQPFQMETIFYDFTNIWQKRYVMRRLWKHNSIAYNDRLGFEYYGQPHASISHDGRWACFATNRGIPDNYWVECGLTGYPTAVSAAGAGAGAAGAMR